MPSTLASSLEDLSLDRDGAQLFRSAVSPIDLRSILETLADQPSDQAGVRLFGVTALSPFLEADGPVGAVVAQSVAGVFRPVRAILFDKTAKANWSLAWHQDRVIAVRRRLDVEGFGPWTRKHGAIHVAPPFSVLTDMVTVRLHLDPVPATNAPLLIAPGSHRLGRIAEANVPEVVARCGVAACLADPGDAWLYSTPILHASEAAGDPRRRRVLQVDYARQGLPGGLEWLGV